MELFGWKLPEITEETTGEDLTRMATQYRAAHVGALILIEGIDCLRACAAFLGHKFTISFLDDPTNLPFGKDHNGQ